MANNTSFSTDSEKNTILADRVFEADLTRVWDAWTVSELLDQWWAPKPYRAETKRMDFKVGGHWLYAMVGPEGNAHWCRADYKGIEPQKSIRDVDNFCDEDGNINRAMPPMTWLKTFTSRGDSTLVHCEISFPDAEGMDKIVAMGFEGGFKMGLENLAEYFRNTPA